MTRELAEDGYSGVEVRVTPTRTEIIILATKTQNVLGEKGRRIRELTAVVQKRFSFPEGSVEVIPLPILILALLLKIYCNIVLQLKKKKTHIFYYIDYNRQITSMWKGFIHSKSGMH